MPGGVFSGFGAEMSDSRGFPCIPQECGRGMWHVLQVSGPVLCDPHWGQVMVGLCAMEAGVERVVFLR